MKSAEIRSSFVEFFKSHGHTHVPSSSLVPADDPTLLFTNAGMVQFKRVFQGLEHRDFSRAVTVQKCVRAGGKHNDLEQVGHTARHLTFFEMLGNFSFGYYFTQEAIELAWEWVTSEQWLGIDPDRLYVTVHHTDDEARKLWRQITGIADQRIYGLGDKDNFWQMADTGPAGPNTELNVDLRSPAERGNGALSLDEFVRLNEEGKLLEIWNLVFMQYDLQQDGSRVLLPKPSVDTGAGLERIAAVLQGVPSNFDTDLFSPIIARAVEVVGRRYDPGPAGAGFRVLADHARAVAFLLADGVYPSNEGRGYVLRRILRRAVRHGYMMGRRDPTLVELTRTVIATMGEFYPELTTRSSHIENVTRAEEEHFLQTIEGGLKRLDEFTSGAAGTIKGEDAFRLYDTYGFPLDLTQIIAAERGWSVDVEGFEAALAEQQERSRKAGKREEGRGKRTAGGPAKRRSAAGDWVKVKPRVRQKFVGYETTSADTDILAYRQGEEQLELVLHENPFYAESGGQVSDTGVVRGAGWQLPVEDVLKVDGKQVVVGRFQGPFEPTEAHAEVAEQRRRDIERNHTATHLVHAALRKVLGPHVRQAGSVVAPERLRFDFSHHAPISSGDLQAIEEEVNRGIWANVPVETRALPYRKALELGAMALFGEKYGDVVRVVDVPTISLELCGGTHVRTTGQIALFHFTGESGVAAGVRRIEAVTGPGAYRVVRALDARIAAAADTLRTNPEHLARRIEGLLEEKRRLEKQVENLIRGGGREAGDPGREFRVGDVTVSVQESALTDRNQIGLMMDTFREQHRNAVAVLTTAGERPGIHVAVTDDLIARGIKAGDLVNHVAGLSGGKGGGRPHFASGSTGDPTKFRETLKHLPEVLAAKLPASAS
ncbi:MAG: alanine--tRNA ligase [Gemmatimonadetes bacterium]|nr:alanine--tRNA ligase [Gemmatimonadota bacterium]